jgi:hypothetical protein
VLLNDLLQLSEADGLQHGPDGALDVIELPMKVDKLKGRNPDCMLPTRLCHTPSSWLILFSPLVYT